MLELVKAGGCGPMIPLLLLSALALGDHRGAGLAASQVVQPPALARVGPGLRRHADRPTSNPFAAIRLGELLAAALASVTARYLIR